MGLQTVLQTQIAYRHRMPRGVANKFTDKVLLPCHGPQLCLAMVLLVLLQQHDACFTAVKAYKRCNASIRGTKSHVSSPMQHTCKQQLCMRWACDPAVLVDTHASQECIACYRYQNSGQQVHCTKIKAACTITW